MWCFPCVKSAVLIWLYYFSNGFSLSAAIYLMVFIFQKRSIFSLVIWGIILIIYEVKYVFGSISGLSIWFHWTICLFMCQLPHCANYKGFLVYVNSYGRRLVPSYSFSFSVFCCLFWVRFFFLHISKYLSKSIKFFWYLLRLY